VDTVITMTKTNTTSVGSPYIPSRRKDKIKFISFGLGPVGLLILQAAVARSDFELVGAVDVNPSIVGQDIGRLIGNNREIGIPVSPDLLPLIDGIISQNQVGLVFHATQSFLDQTTPQFIDLLSCGLNVVSTCETLAYPYRRYPNLADQLDQVAKSNRCTLVGTGINPGFLLDLLPIFLTTACQEVTGIQAVRNIDAAKRRGPFQKKVGLNLSPENFTQQIETGQLSAHVGLAESVYLIGDTLGMNLDQVVEEHRPVIADCAYSSAEVEIEAGRVRGVNSFGRGLRNQQEVVRIDFNAVVSSQEYEEIKIEGYPPVIWRNELGTAGDSATAAVILNMGKRVVAAQPGLLTAVDLSLPHFTRT